MTAKEYLSQIRQLDIRISQERAELARIKADALGLRAVSYDGDAVSHSSEGGASFERLWERYEQMAERITKDMGKLYDTRIAIIAQINGMPDLLYAQVLYKRYVEYMSLAAIADDLGYDGDYIRHVHGWALDAFDALYGIT